MEYERFCNLHFLRAFWVVTNLYEVLEASEELFNSLELLESSLILILFKSYLSL